MSRVVSNLVVQAEAAAAEAIARHFSALVEDRPREIWPRIALALDHEYTSDLDERTSPDQPVGFDHPAISRAFSRRLRSLLYNKRVSHHIWEGDEEQGLFSLFPRTVTPQSRAPRRTRASALVQQMIRDCRDFRQADKATKSQDPTQQITIPSPLAVAGRLLGDPESPGSQTYAWAAMQEWVRERIEDETQGVIDLGFAAVSEALTLITNRWKTSKPIVADLKANGPTVLFLCNVLALRGIAAMRVDIGYLHDALRPARDVPLGEDPEFTDSERGHRMDAQLRDLWLGRAGRYCEFIINPRVVELPSASEVLNLVDSLPMPFEGGETVFQGGIRLSADRSLVATISGEFGTGKTLFGLSLAAALAPLGCRTLFLSCEESARDITQRLVEAAPRSLFRSLPLFKALDQDDFRPKSLNALRDEGGELGWFSAAQLRLEQTSADGVADPSFALESLVKEAVENARLFEPWLEGTDSGLPRFARPVIIMDGLHQLFDNPQTWPFLDQSLRSLIETCRGLGAVFLFSFSKEAEDLKRLEYLCDLIIEVERGGHDDPAEKPYRVFQLLKARRQPARTGAHVFHIKGDAGFRLKPSVDAHVQEVKTQMWWSPTDREAIFLTADPPPGFRPLPNDAVQSNSLSVANHGQVLVIGHGSSGKAGFGLYLLHRRWFDTGMFPDRQRKLPIGGSPMADAPRWKQAIHDAGLLVRADAPYLETRVLVISFLYQRTYYDDLTRRLGGKQRGKPRRDEAPYTSIALMEPMEFAPLPDRLWTDTIELYPGLLSAEDFLAKVEKRLAAAERSGFPYTGVLVDGLHNVFVQFPLLEKDSSFWGMFYNILRRRRVTVVTTHTEFDINSHGEPSGATPRGFPMAYNFEQAERKIAPLLSALVSGADYLFDLSPSHEAGSPVYRLTPRAMLGDNIAGHAYVWDKQNLQLDPISVLPGRSRPPVDSHAEAVIRISERLASLLR